MLSILTLRYLIILVFVGLLVWAIISDITSLRIPNRLPLAVAVLFAAYVTTGPAGVDWLGSLLVACAVFAGATVLFHFRLMGGGDVKLMAAVALWAGPSEVLGFLIVTSLVGGLLALIAVTRLRQLVEYAFAAIGSCNRAAHGIARGVVPYGIAIAAGGFAVAASLLLGS